MSYLAFVGCFIFLISGTFFSEEKDFKQWMKNYGKKYDSLLQFRTRYSIWKKTVEKINKWNQEKTFGEARFAPSKFADLTIDEIRIQNGRPPRKVKTRTSSKYQSENGVSAPSSINWTALGAVTGVKNQNQCGSCWSFCTTGAIEGAHFIKTGNLVSLSEQNLIDCSSSDPNCTQCGITCCNNQGCNGGRSDWGMDYVINNGGIDTEESYPYTGTEASCKYNAATSGATISEETTVTEGSESALMNQIGNGGPVAVSISVDDAFANYEGGVFTDESCPNEPNQLDHCVLAVGYGTNSNSQDYWIVKNSWGATWGLDGYILMRRNFNNMCGIATDAVYATA